MGAVTHRGRYVNLLLVAALLVGLGAAEVRAQDTAMKDGGTEPGQFYLGMRAGFAPLTQQLTPGTSTEVGSLVNFQAMYSLNTWLLIGMMLEWERHSVNTDGPGSVNLGHQDTVSVLPTVEIRPVRFGAITPYVNMSFGVNVNSVGEDRNLGGNRVSPSNNFAWRLGWGADWMIMKHLALNAEMAYKRNDGHATVTGPGPLGSGRVDDWNASSFGFLFGVKWFF